jgi:hypothetical protein
MPGRGRPLWRWLLVAATFVSSMPVLAQTEFECRGRDLFAELSLKNPAEHARILTRAEAEFGPFGRLFRATSPNGKVSHLFGTAHLADRRITELPAAVDKAFSDSKIILTELDNLNSPGDFVKNRAMFAEILASRDQALVSFLSEPELQRVRDALTARGYPYNLTDTVRPWVVIGALAITPCDTRLGKQRAFLDKSLIERARRERRSFLGLEVPEEQGRAFNALPSAGQAEYVREYIRFEDRVDDIIETLKVLYLAGRIGVIRVLSDARGFPEAKAFEMPAILEDSILIKRNVVMVERALPFLEDGGAFMAVGALHFPGKGGIIALLQARGYRIEKVE